MEHWTAVSTSLGLISSAYHNLHHQRSNPQPQNVETELLPRATNSCYAPVMPMRSCMIIYILKVRFYLTKNTTTPRATTSLVGVMHPHNYIQQGKN